MFSSILQIWYVKVWISRSVSAGPFYSMPSHVLLCVFHVEKLSCTQRFFHKYEQTHTEKFAHALLRWCCLNIVAKYGKWKSDFVSKFRNRTHISDGLHRMHTGWHKPAPRWNRNKLFIYVVKSQMTTFHHVVKTASPYWNGINLQVFTRGEKRKAQDSNEAKSAKQV